MLNIYRSVAILLFIGFGCQQVLAQNSFSVDGKATIKRPGATLFIINDSQSAWTRSGLVLYNPAQAVTTNFEILYEKTAQGIQVQAVRYSGRATRQDF
jgi:hypothetical protein